MGCVLFLKCFKSMMNEYLGSVFPSNRLLFMFHKIPIGFSPLAIHWSTVLSPFSAVWDLVLISKEGGAK